MRVLQCNTIRYPRLTAAEEIECHPELFLRYVFYLIFALFCYYVLCTSATVLLNMYAMQCNTIQYNRYNTISYNTLQCNTMQYNRYNAISYNTVQCNTMQYNIYNAISYNTVQCNAIDTMPYHTIQCNSIQCNTIQYIAIQYKAMQCNRTSRQTATDQTILVCILHAIPK